MMYIHTGGKVSPSPFVYMDCLFSSSSWWEREDLSNQCNHAFSFTRICIYSTTNVIHNIIVMDTFYRRFLWDLEDRRAVCRILSEARVLQHRGLLITYKQTPQSLTNLDHCVYFCISYFCLVQLNYTLYIRVYNYTSVICGLEHLFWPIRAQYFLQLSDGG